MQAARTGQNHGESETEEHNPKKDSETHSARRARVVGAMADLDTQTLGQQIFKANKAQRAQDGRIYTATVHIGPKRGFKWVFILLGLEISKNHGFFIPFQIF